MSEVPINGWRQATDDLWYPPRPDCDCEDAAAAGRELRLHVEEDDPESEVWGLLGRLIDEAAADERDLFAPKADLPVDLWPDFVTLPPTVAKLTAVRALHLYGTHLVAIPPEIGEMSSLTTFDPYTSWRLHWFPYEITTCARLRESRVSTRCLYGNQNTRLPFPALPAEVPSGSVPSRCSVCEGPFDVGGPIQTWISLRVATDVLPLLVHACSPDCIDALPDPAKGHVDYPHEGGSKLRQPPARYA